MSVQRTVYQWETTRIDVALVDSAGSAIDLTGATTYLYVKHKVWDASAVITKTWNTIAPASGGLAYFELTSAETEDLTEYRYVYEVWLKNADGDLSKIIWPETMRVVQSWKIPA